MDSMTFVPVPKEEWEQIKSLMEDIKALLAPKEEYLTTEQACRMLGVTPNTFASFRKKYKLPSSQVGRNILTPRSAIEKLIKQTQL